MATITVTHLLDDRFRVEIREHELLVDQPRPAGEDAGPSPTELFVAALVTCVGGDATRFLREHSQRYAGLWVDCDWRPAASGPDRVGRVSLRVVPPAPVPRDLHQPLRRAIDRCAVHNCLREPPEVTLGLAC